MFYTGIGSRETPEEVLTLMIRAAMILDLQGIGLRSGGADGADSAFEKGALLTEKEIYLPWKGFNNNQSKLNHVGADALEMASKYHPAWERLSQGAKKLHSRNCYQVLGQDLKSPSVVVICYTKGGKGGGGTGQAIRIAKDNNIPILDFGSYEKPHELFEDLYDLLDHL